MGCTAPTQSTPSFWTGIDGEEPMTSKNRQALLSKLRRALNDKESSEKFWGAMAKDRANRTALLEKEHLDMHKMKESNKALKTAAVRDRRLVEEFAENVRRNGGKVFLAKTGEDAIRYV